MSATPDPYRPFDDGHYFIDLNKNYPVERANAFLCKRDDKSPFGSWCVGGSEKTFKGPWISDLHCAWCEDRESGLIPLGEFPTQAEALQTLWNNRINV